MTESLPPIPPSPTEQDWSPAVYEAYASLEAGYQSNAQMLSLGEADPLRLTILLDKTVGQYKDLLLHLSEQPNMPEAWIESCAEAFAEQITDLGQAIAAASGADDNNVIFETHIEVVRSGSRGRPRKVINPASILRARRSNPNVTVSQLAKEFNVHRNTLRAQMKNLGIKRGYDDIPEAQLDEIVSNFKRERPLTGHSYLIGSLRAKGFRVQQWRLKHAVARVDKLSTYLRKRKAIVRRKYQVKRPHSLWHLDGHHKLIRWGIVIHGVIDGHSRLVISLRARTDNSAETVEALFKAAADAIGTYPSRARADRGAENTRVAVLMILIRGLNRGSFIWGSSTHNTRIERLWLEIGRFLGHQWRAFFTRLERLHFMDPKKGYHLWLLHVLFLDAINADCDEFKRTWNHKPIARQGKNLSPNDMVRLGHVVQGRYKTGVEDDDDCAGVPEALIEKHYGTCGRPQARSEGRLGAGDSENESEDDEIERVSQKVRKTVERNVKHDAVEVPAETCPFSDAASGERFQQVWDELRALKFIPSGFGLTPEELERSPYPSHESIRHGKGRSKMLKVPLPHDPWKARAELWAVSLYALERFLLENAQ